jgi:serine/threonine protein kinase
LNIPLESELFYLSPEVLSNSPYTPSADIYALGILLYEMSTLTKKPDYSPSGKTLGSLPFFQSLPSIYSPSVHQILEACLREDPEKRATCRELLVDVEALNYKASELIGSEEFRKAHEEGLWRRVDCGLCGAEELEKYTRFRV